MLTFRLLPPPQSLSTLKLTQEQASDTTLDLLTGFHLVDGKERVVVLEGLEAGAMKVIKVMIMRGRLYGGTRWRNR